MTNRMAKLQISRARSIGRLRTPLPLIQIHCWYYLVKN